MKRGGPLKRKTPLRAKKGLAPGKPLKVVASKSRPTKAWLAAKKSRCQVCGRRSGLHQHHVVLAQHVRKRGGDQWDPRDSLTVCFEEHGRHHDGGPWRIPVAKLTVENLRFAVELLGDGTAEYLARYYYGTRDEVEARLAPLRAVEASAG